MIKVIEGFKVAGFKDIEPILQKIRSNAIQYPGFVSDESLIGYGEISTVILLSVWHNIDTWRLWENSTIRRKLHEQLRELLEEEPRTTIYTVWPAKIRTTDWR